MLSYFIFFVIVQPVISELAVIILERTLLYSVVISTTLYKYFFGQCKGAPISLLLDKTVSDTCKCTREIISKFKMLEKIE